MKKLKKPEPLPPDPKMVYNLLDLLEMTRENRLPEGQKAFRYKSTDSVQYIHIDELKKELALVDTFGKQYEDKLIGIKTSKNFK